MTLLLLGGRWRWLAPLGLLAVLIAMLLVQSRAPVAAALVAITFMLFLLRKWRILFTSLSIVLASGVYLGLTQPEIAQRYAMAMSPQTYTQAFVTQDFQLGDGFSGRTPIWFGLLEITKQRTWTGYGFGWKKLGPVAVEGGYVARWAAQKNDIFAAEQARYFSQNPSTVNPHNLYLQLYFESGLVGLISYLLLLLILFVQAAHIAWRGNAFNRLIGAMVFAYLIDHVILGMFNGLLIGLGPSLALIALLETVRRSEKST
jgi:O-antigen ligase